MDFFPLLILGNINQSLLNLRTCIEILRENQMCGTNRVRHCTVPPPERRRGGSLTEPVVLSCRWFPTETPK